MREVPCGRNAPQCTQALEGVADTILITSSSNSSSNNSTATLVTVDAVAMAAMGRVLVAATVLPPKPRRQLRRRCAALP